MIFVAIFIFFQMRNEKSKMSEVAPGLFLSDWESAIDENRLRYFGITQIICISRREKTDRDRRMYQRLGIQHHQYYLDDRPDAPIELIFEEVHRLCATPVTLIHCQMGISRSVTAAAAHLMQKNNVSADQALAQIRQARPVASPNSGFLRALARLESRRALQTCTLPGPLPDLPLVPDSMT